MIFVYIVLSLISVYIIACLIMIASGVKESRNIPKGTVGIVLGCRVIDDQPCPMLARRCERAKKYLDSDDTAILILSGGKGSDEGISEAQAMYNYLTSLGVSSDRLIKEDKSTTTLENMKFTKDILDELGRGDEAVVITTNFHQFRAQIMAKREGIIPYRLCSSLAPASMLKNVLREIIVMPSLFKK